MQTQTLPRVATRHECALWHRIGGTHTAGAGAPRRKRCAYCGGTFVTLRGWYGVFVHSSVTGDNRYRRENAYSLESTERAAQRVIDADDTNTLVIRWVSE